MAIQDKLAVTENYSFRKKENEEQFKMNPKVLDKIREADGHIQVVTRDTVNSEILARTFFSRNFAYAKFRENKTLVNRQTHSVVY